ncbi:MAG: hypothetical protein LBR33_00845 [Propionibacteriaceae bacterium]|nr:hypothetical protein [Propionibacteriaceae bacterium]
MTDQAAAAAETPTLNYQMTSGAIGHYGTDRSGSDFNKVYGWLAAHDKAIPADMQDAARRLDAIASRAPDGKPEPLDMKDLYLNGATDEAIMSLAVEFATAEFKQMGKEMAMHVASREALSAMWRSTGDVIELLRPEAEAAIATIIWYAQHGQPTPEALLRAGNTSDAMQAAAALPALQTWWELRKIRASATASDEDYWNDEPKYARSAAKVGTWRTLPAEAHTFSTKAGALENELDTLAQFISQGAVPWWPSLAEAQAAWQERNTPPTPRNTDQPTATANLRRVA